MKKINDPNIVLVAPDAGAAKKIFHLASELNISEIITCEKKRNVNNGELSDFKIHADDIKNKNCLIIDDICDGGRTFVGIAKALKNKNAGKIYLAVSHGIFSNGFEKLKRVLDDIYSTDSFGEIENRKVEIVKLKSFIKTINQN